uniref:Uncharacterized protein n=1 Tax=uncultured marine group II/III euryarchaeote KM3_149_F06 TaxID=1457885 RepID=A0A075GHY6_9EURY|nr:hypothetical protein [uncultured marine group II/III euryarchaeote KM3_149_F06]
MKLEVNLSKKYFFILLGAILILAGAIYSYAQPEIFGHDWYEIDNRPAGLDNGDDYYLDTNADTKCSGTNTYLDGNGGCDSATTIVNNGGGGSISLTNCGWYKLPGGGNGGNGYKEKICPGNRVVVGYKNYREGDWTRTGHASIRCCKLTN